jgi:hypothetical protein
MKVSMFRSATGSKRQKPTQSSIRGRISNPIPITNAIDDELAAVSTAPGAVPPDVSQTGNTTSQQSPPSPHLQPHAATISSPSLAHSGLAHTQKTGSNVGPSKHGGSNTSLSPSAAELAVPARLPGPPNTGPSAASELNAAPPSEERRTCPYAQMRNSAISTSTRRTGDLSNGDFPQRKKSTLRGALSKLFGRRRKGGSGTSTEEPSARNSAYYRSVSCSPRTFSPCTQLP